MEYRSLGKAGLKVTKMCLGTMTFGVQADKKTSFEILDRGLEAGINFIDTADVYPIGRALIRWYNRERCTTSVFQIGEHGK